MKITKSQLKQIIKEELENVLEEKDLWPVISQATIALHKAHPARDAYNKALAAWAAAMRKLPGIDDEALNATMVGFKKIIRNEDPKELLQWVQRVVRHAAKRAKPENVLEDKSPFVHGDKVKKEVYPETCEGEPHPCAGLTVKECMKKGLSNKDQEMVNKISCRPKPVKD